MIILNKKYSKFYLMISAIIFLGLVWSLGNYGSNGELVIAELLLLIYLDGTFKQKENKWKI